jgi:hypothetical protein
VILMIFLVGCDVLTGAPAAPGSTTPSAAEFTTQAAETSAAEATQTAALITPTVTPTATEAPTLTPTLTPTITLTPFLGAFPGDLDCKVRSQSMKNGTHIDARTRFDVGWKVINTGTVTWEPGNTDFTYVDGTRMYQAEALPLQTVVAPGDVVALSAALLSPKHPGTYMTVWALRRGENRFCRVSVEIIVP